MIKAYQAGVPRTAGLFRRAIVKLQWEPEKSTEAPFETEAADVFQQAFVMEMDRKRFPKTGGWGYAAFNCNAASEKFRADLKSRADDRQSRDAAVKAKDYIFHPYQKR